jgi:hypothetical protein
MDGESGPGTRQAPAPTAAASRLDLAADGPGQHSRSGVRNHRLQRHSQSRISESAASFPLSNWKARGKKVKPTEENLHVLRLVEAMIGSVTPNFRGVTLELATDGAVIIRFLLERESASDREEIDDIGFELDALQETSVHIRIEVLVDDRPFTELEHRGRPVYGRRE